MSVVRISDGQRRRWSITITPINGSTGAIDVESQPEHGVRLIELDVFRQNGAFFTGNSYTKVQIVRKVRLMRQTLIEKMECSVTQSGLRLWRAVVWHGSCANIPSRFRTWPWLSCASAKIEHDCRGFVFSCLNVTPSGNFCRTHNNLP